MSTPPKPLGHYIQMPPPDFIPAGDDFPEPHAVAPAPKFNERLALRVELVVLWCHEQALMSPSKGFPGSNAYEIARVNRRQCEVRAALGGSA